MPYVSLFVLCDACLEIRIRMKRVAVWFALLVCAAVPSFFRSRWLGVGSCRLLACVRRVRSSSYTRARVSCGCAVRCAGGGRARGVRRAVRAI